MPNIISRIAQRALLESMRDTYPLPCTQLPEVEGCDEDSLIANLYYLEEHGLCRSGVLVHSDDDIAWGGEATITAHGIDFLAEDGGLSAILGVVTIRLHADTVRDLLAKRIDDAPITPEEKRTLKAALRKLPENALAAATTELIQTGLHHVPNFVAWLRAISGF
jgi:hypothetical protein